MTKKPTKRSGSTVKSHVGGPGPSGLAKAERQAVQADSASELQAVRSQLEAVQAERKAMEEELERERQQRTSFESEVLILRGRLGVAFFALKEWLASKAEHQTSAETAELRAMLAAAEAARDPQLEAVQAEQQARKELEQERTLRASLESEVLFLRGRLGVACAALSEWLASKGEHQTSAGMAELIKAAVVAAEEAIYRDPPPPKGMGGSSLPRRRKPWKLE